MVSDADKRRLDQLEDWLTTLDEETLMYCWFEGEFSELTPFRLVKFNCRRCEHKIKCYELNLIPIFEGESRRSIEDPTPTNPPMNFDFNFETEDGFKHPPNLEYE